MKRIVPLLLGLVLAGTAAAQTTHTVTLSGFTFSPDDLTIEAGDTVVFDNVSGIHSVNGTLASYPSNPEGFTSGPPASAPWQYSFTFTIPGAYGYHCDVHGAPGSGMFGSITVLPAGGCDLSFNAADLSYDAGTRTLTVQVTVHNGGATPHTDQLALDYNRNGGSPQGTKVLGTGTLPAGATASRTLSVRVPGAAPSGNYNFTLRLIDTGTGTDCDSYAETIAISGPRVGMSGSDDFEVDRVVDLTPEASAVTASPATLTVTPNPTRGQATLRYTLTETADVRLAVYDALGREVAVLAEGREEAGAHAAVLDTRALPAGVYVYRLSANGATAAGRLTVAK